MVINDKKIAIDKSNGLLIPILHMYYLCYVFFFFFSSPLCYLKWRKLCECCLQIGTQLRQHITHKMNKEPGIMTTLVDFKKFFLWDFMRAKGCSVEKCTDYQTIEEMFQKPATIECSRMNQATIFISFFFCSLINFRTSSMNLNIGNRNWSPHTQGERR